MKNFRFLILFVILAFTLPYTYGGCGGGGGSSDSGLVYSGLTSQATLSDSNAEDISGGAFGAGLISDGLNQGLPGLSSVDQDLAVYHMKNLRSMKLPQILIDSLELIDFASASSDNLQAAIQSDPITIYDDCGGSVSFTFTYNDATGSISGRLAYSNFGCGETTISGVVSFNGSFDVDTNDFIEAEFSFYNLAGGNLTLEGDLSVDFTASPDKIIFEAYGQDPISGLVFWIDDYVVTIDDDDEYPIEIEMSGRFCHPYHGCVTLSTETTFEFELNNITYLPNEWPTVGSIVVTGANNSKIRLAANDEYSCRLVADLNGDGFYDDWGPVDVNWEDL